jgi:hypothetical protein
LSKSQRCLYSIFCPRVPLISLKTSPSITSTLDYKSESSNSVSRSDKQMKTSHKTDKAPLIPFKLSSPISPTFEDDSKASTW